MFFMLGRRCSRPAGSSNRSRPRCWLVFAIRTRRRFFRSRPRPFLMLTTLGVVGVAVVLPFIPIGSWFGFVALPPPFFAYFVGATLAYLVLVEVTKDLFYRFAIRPLR